MRGRFFRLFVTPLVLLAWLFAPFKLYGEENSAQEAASSFDVLWTNYRNNSRITQMYVFKVLLSGKDLTLTEGAVLKIDQKDNAEYKSGWPLSKSCALSLEETDGGTMLIANLIDPNSNIVSGVSSTFKVGFDVYLTIPAGAVKDAEGKANPKIQFRYIGGSSKDNLYSQSEARVFEVLLPGNKVIEVEAFPESDNVVKVTPPSGWKINKFLCGGEDRIKSLMYGAYTVKPQVDPKIEVGFEYTGAVSGTDSHTSGMVCINDGKIEVTPVSYGLEIRGATEGERVAVYTLQGYCVARFNASESVNCVPLVSGTYLVVIGNEAAKVIIK